MMVGAKWLPGAAVLGVGLCCLAQTPPATAAVLTPASPTVVAGNAITLTLNDTIAPNSGIGAVAVQVTFDQTLLSLVSVADGTLLTGWNTPIFNSSNGSISISECGLCDDAEGTGSVLSLTFTALAADPTTLAPLTAQTTPGRDVGAAGEYQLALTSTTIGITAAPVTPPTKVPEPGTIALLLAPMLAAAGLKRRDRC